MNFFGIVGGNVNCPEPPKEKERLKPYDYNGWRIFPNAEGTFTASNGYRMMVGANKEHIEQMIDSVR